MATKIDELKKKPDLLYMGPHESLTNAIGIDLATGKDRTVISLGAHSYTVGDILTITSVRRHWWQRQTYLVVTAAMRNNVEVVSRRATFLEWLWCLLAR